MFRRRCTSALLLLGALLGLLGAAGPARAHPGDEASVYHYLWLETRPGRLELQHATIVGGLLAPAQWAKLDRNGDEALSDAEQEAHARALAARIELSIDGKPAPFKLEKWEYPSHAEFFGSAMAAVKLLLSAPLPPVPAAGVAVRIRDETYPAERGVFPEPEVRPASMRAETRKVSKDGRAVAVRFVPAAAELPSLKTRAEQPSPLSAPGAAEPLAPRVSPGDAGAILNGPSLDQKPLFPDRGKILVANPDGHREGEAEPLRRLLDRPLTPGLLALGLLTALLLGAAHALTPGHGKSMVAAYLVGSRGTVADAVLLGVVVTITHTASVYILGFLSLWLTTRIQAETVAHWLSLASGFLVLGMGFWLFQRGLLAYYGLAPAPGGHSHAPGGHSHGHTHSHAHTHTHSHTHAPDCTHGHAHEAESLTPNTQHPTPPHDHPHDDPQASTQPPTPHTLHPTPEPYNRWGVIGLGVAGGMVPCFDAMAVLIAAVNLRQIALGLVLIAAFSLGMALVLVTLGVLMVTAKGLMERFTGEARWVKALPAVSGAVLLVLGGWLSLQALAEAGVIRLGAG